jgi:hypothetical protein
MVTREDDCALILSALAFYLVCGTLGKSISTLPSDHIVPVLFYQLMTFHAVADGHVSKCVLFVGLLNYKLHSKRSFKHFSHAWDTDNCHLSISFCLNINSKGSTHSVSWLSLLFFHVEVERTKSSVVESVRDEKWSLSLHKRTMAKFLFSVHH